MGDFNLGALPIADTVDRRGDSFTQGLGGANPSMAGNLIQGALTGAAQTTNILNAQNEAKVRFDPERLAAEKLQRDVSNRILQENLKAQEFATTMRDKYGETEVTLGLDQKRASITASQASAASSYASANKTGIEARILKETGLDDARAVTEERRARAAKLQSEADYTNQYGSAEATQKFGAGLKDIADANVAMKAGDKANAFSDPDYPNRVPKAQNQQQVPPKNPIELATENWIIS